MGTKRRAYTDKFKAKVALDAVRGIKTLGLPWQSRRGPVWWVGDVCDTDNGRKSFTIQKDRNLTPVKSAA
jgi:hypothetical protein